MAPIRRVAPNDRAAPDESPVVDASRSIGPRLALGMTRTQRLWLSLVGLTVSLGDGGLAGRLGRRDARPDRRTSPGAGDRLRRGRRAGRLGRGHRRGAAALEARPRRAARRPAPPRTSWPRPTSRPRRPRPSSPRSRTRGPRPGSATSWPTLRADRQARRFHVVVFGTGSAGKTSLINALLGRTVGLTEPTIGTTKAGEAFTYEIEDVDGTVLLTDTPGLSEIGEGGAVREAEARDLAARADLLLFVVDHDLIRSEFEPMVALARQGKRSIVALNKKDRLIDEDREAILAKLRERLAGWSPRPTWSPSRPRPGRCRCGSRRPTGPSTTVLEAEPPDVEPLRDRIAAVLDREGDTLRAGNLLLRAHLINEEARGQLSRSATSGPRR